MGPRAVLLGLLWSIGRAYRGWLGGHPFTPFDNTVRHSVATLAHVQLTLGYLLYLVSPSRVLFTCATPCTTPAHCFSAFSTCWP